MNILSEVHKRTGQGGGGGGGGGGGWLYQIFCVQQEKFGQSQVLKKFPNLFIISKR